MQVEPSIFKAYDIRGIYPSQLNEPTAKAIARGFATLLFKEVQQSMLKIGVGKDMRLSSPQLTEAVIAGLQESGVQVVELQGLVSTPTFYAAVAKHGLDGGIQITASHNPGEYNGLKLVRSNGRPVSGKDGIQEILDYIQTDSFTQLVPAEKQLPIQQLYNVTEDVIETYIDMLDIDLESLKPFKIVIDPANAMGIMDYGILKQHLPQVQFDLMNFELDGRFPSHEADPLKPENTKALRARVLETGADLGIASDGDSDRVFIIDDKGRTVPSPILYMLIANLELQQYPEATYAYEIRLGKLVEDEFKQTKARLVQTAVGHSIIKAAMLKNNAVFGGEISGHYFFRLPYGTFEAPAYLVLKLLEFLSSSQKKLSVLVDALDRYFSSGEVNTAVESRSLVEEKITKLQEQYNDGEQILLDGVKVTYPHWWFSVRASNTEPVMRLIVEADSKQLMEEKRDELLQLLRS